MYEQPPYMSVCLDNHKPALLCPLQKLSEHCFGCRHPVHRLRNGTNTVTDNNHQSWGANMARFSLHLLGHCDHQSDGHHNSGRFLHLPLLLGTG